MAFEPKVVPVGIVRIILEASNGIVETSFNELLSHLDPAVYQSTIDGYQYIVSLLNSYNLVLDPPASVGTMDAVRILRSHRLVISIPEIAVKEAIEMGECAVQEFKASLMYDHKKAQNVSGIQLAGLKSEDVIHSTMKSVAGFLNARGGALWIGISDVGDIVGIEFDFPFLHAEHQSRDGWENELRNLLAQRFDSGSYINNFVDVSFANIDGKAVAKVNIRERKKLSFLRKSKSDPFRLYCRQGNSTREISITEIEEFILGRRNPT